MTFCIMVIVGTRPEVIKMSPVIREIRSDPELDLIFVNSGQHYDHNLFTKFIEDLELPNPDLNLSIGSGTHSEQTSEMLLKFEKIIQEHSPDVVLAEGDTNTVLAASLASAKLQVPFGHIEAGIRSFDKNMPEEINRRVAAVCAELHFAPSDRAAKNLLHEGILPHRIFVTGNTVVDACLQNVEIARQRSKILESYGISKDQNVVTVTLHRPENVDKKEPLKQIVEILNSVEDCKLVFPVHPRTKKNLIKFGLLEALKENENIIISEPIGYIDFLKLLSDSKFALTDSGGIQEEALIFKVPCLTLRKNTERPETVEIGANKLIHNDKKLALYYINNILTAGEEDNLFKFQKNPYGDGDAGKRIVSIIKTLLSRARDNDSSLMTTANFLDSGIIDYHPYKLEEHMVGKKIKTLQKNKKISIILVYDKKGNFIFPHEDSIIQKLWDIIIYRNI